MTNGTSYPALVFRRMGSPDRPDVFALLGQLLKNDAYYRQSSAAYGAPQDLADADAALAEALTLWIDRPDYGFVWLALDGERVLGCAAVSYAISASVGKIVAKLDYCIVAPEVRRRGVGTQMMDSLEGELRRIEIGRMDVGVHVANDAAKQFYIDLVFLPRHEESFSLPL